MFRVKNDERKEKTNKKIRTINSLLSILSLIVVMEAQFSRVQVKYNMSHNETCWGIEKNKFESGNSGCIKFDPANQCQNVK